MLDREKIIVISPGRIDDLKWQEEEEKLNENSKLLDELERLRRELDDRDRIIK